MGTFYPTYLSVKQLKRKVEEGEVKNDESKKGDGFDGDLSFNTIDRRGSNGAKREKEGENAEKKNHLPRGG